MDIDKEVTTAHTILFIVMALLAVILISTAMCGCTYSITQMHTEGTASDVVDETATNTPTTTANATIPLK